MDCLELAAAARELDMRASPYDLRDYGFEPIAIETPAGRAEYVRAQQSVAERAAPLRASSGGSVRPASRRGGPRIAQRDGLGITPVSRWVSWIDGFREEK